MMVRCVLSTGSNVFVEQLWNLVLEINKFITGSKFNGPPLKRDGRTRTRFESRRLFFPTSPPEDRRYPEVAGKFLSHGVNSSQFFKCISWFRYLHWEHLHNRDTYILAMSIQVICCHWAWGCALIGTWSGVHKTQVVWILSPKGGYGSKLSTL